jgi:hypothetical protein
MEKQNMPSRLLNIRLPEDLADRLDQYLDGLDPRPSRNSALTSAVRAWLDGRGTTVGQIAALMEAHVHLLPDSQAWKDFADSMPTDMDATAPAEWAEYWRKVAYGQSEDYDPETGDRLKK